MLAAIQLMAGAGVSNACGGSPARDRMGEIPDSDRVSRVGHDLLKGKIPRELQAHVCRPQGRLARRVSNRIEVERNLSFGSALSVSVHVSLFPG